MFAEVSGENADSILYPEDGDSKTVRNTGRHRSDYTLSETACSSESSPNIYQRTQLTFQNLTYRKIT
jgi:hypothetical protein